MSGVAVSPQLFAARVTHKRLGPKQNRFGYRVYYLALPLSALVRPLAVAVNRPGLISFWERDHGDRSGVSLQTWIDQRLRQHRLDGSVSDVVLVAMPRIIGYAFNPVSFWLCLNSSGQLQAVLCEVNNTFGESHSYLCAHEDGRPIDKHAWLMAEKCFHVSPFLDRVGRYQFRFSLEADRLAICINYYDEQGVKTLVTSLAGRLEPLTRKALMRATLEAPLVTVKTIVLIHWQALKLLAKGCRFFTKPEQHKERLSTTGLKKSG